MGTFRNKELCTFVKWAFVFCLIYFIIQKSEQMEYITVVFIIIIIDIHTFIMGDILLHKNLVRD